MKNVHFRDFSKNTLDIKMKQIADCKKIYLSSTLEAFIAYLMIYNFDSILSMLLKSFLKPES